MSPRQLAAPSTGQSTSPCKAPWLDVSIQKLLASTLVSP